MVLFSSGASRNTGAGEHATIKNDNIDIIIMDLKVFIVFIIISYIDVRKYTLYYDVNEIRLHNKSPYITGKSRRWEKLSKIFR